MSEKPFKVLVVDDNPKNIQVIGNILRESTDYIVGVAMDGKHALELLLLAGDYDLVLMDIMMPVMNGYETCKEMRKIEELKETPVLFLTAYNEPEQVVTGFGAGAQDFVTKPFNSKELLARVKTHLELKSRGDKLKLMLSEKEKLIAELNEAIANVKTLRSLLPICANCKKIREDDGYWSQVDTYIASHTGTTFSHGICPDCLRKLYPEIADEVLKDIENKL